VFDCERSVIVHRYRDANSDIRRECATALGELMLAHPAAFLGDAYLKYLGWMLSDRDVVVREAALTALASVYGKHADKGKLDLFSQRFKRRLVEMTLDKADSVAALAVGMCLQLAQLGNVLENDDIIKLYHLTSCDRDRVRAAAAQFANQYFLEFVVPENIEKSALRGGGGVS
jgi:cohesin complex subunit SA-1/2